MVDQPRCTKISLALLLTVEESTQPSYSMMINFIEQWLPTVNRSKVCVRIANALFADPHLAFPLILGRNQKIELAHRVS